MSDKRTRYLAPRPKGVRCVSNPYVRHGEGHNRVCVCLCAWCVAERQAMGEPERAPEGTDGLRAAPEQFTLALEAA